MPAQRVGQKVQISRAPENRYRFFEERARPLAIALIERDIAEKDTGLSLFDLGMRRGLSPDFQTLLKSRTCRRVVALDILQQTQVSEGRGDIPSVSKFLSDL